MFISNGFDAFISKPIDIRQLNAVLNKHIRDKQPPEVIENARKQKSKKIPLQFTPIDDSLLSIFARDAKKSIAVLQSIHAKGDACDKENLQMFIANTHAMKSALANIGEKKLSKLASELEQAAREQNFSVITAKVPEFLSALQILIEKATPKQEEDTVDEDVAYLREKLLAIQSACEAYDKKNAKKALAELNGKTWSHKTKETLEKIAEHILHSDFEAVVAIVKESNRLFVD
jgi:HPt (histidine-containing phosphotransfer) domain-containing protein